MAQLIVFYEIFFILKTLNRFLGCDSRFLADSQKGGEQKLVYCTKCGTKNENEAEVCSNCKEPLGARLRVKREQRQKENECFGLPNGGAIAGLVIGLLIILWGLSAFLDIDIPIWSFIIIILGTLMVAGAIYSMGRKR